MIQIGAQFGENYLIVSCVVAVVVGAAQVFPNQTSQRYHILRISGLHPE